jgi:DNA adenine methylase
VDALPEFAERFREVQVENLDYREAIRRYDGPDVLIYADPPYLVRHCPDKMYAHEMQSVEAHRELAETLNSVKGMVVLSGYPGEEYREWYDKRGWVRCEFDVPCSTSCRGSRANLKGLNKPRRTECVWLNPACVQAREKGKVVQLTLADFGVGF